MDSSSSDTIPTNPLPKLADKRLRRFSARFTKVLKDDHPDAIHDARVWSRRLQEVLKVTFPKPRSGKQRKLIRTLRKVRRQLGNCRNIDVNIDLITQGLNEASEPSTREAWEQFRSYLQEAREGEIRRARKKLSPYKVAEFVALSHACFDRVRPQLESGNHHARLDDSLQQARRRWTETLAVTKTNRSPDQLHALRIAAKNLRYRAELLAEFEDAPAKALVKKMKKLQQGLGSWHDRHVLFQSVAEFIGRPDFLLSHPETARSLLNEMARERNRETAAVEEILKQAEKI